MNIFNKVAMQGLKKEPYTYDRDDYRCNSVRCYDYGSDYLWSLADELYGRSSSQ